jgi:hypothetical protein
VILFGAVDAGAASKQSSLKPNRIEVRYVEPESADHHLVFKLLMQRQALEKLNKLLSPIRLPRTLVVGTKGCGGTVNAWYDGKAVIVCYELIDNIWKNAAETTTPAGIAPVDTIIGPVVHVFLHEVAHALFDLLKIPVLGSEEHAADQFAAYLMLQFEKDEARRLITGSAYQYKAEIGSPTVTMALQQFSDDHGTGAQRFYSLLCMAYGADQQVFADFVTSGLLPKARADRCPAEYVQAANAFAVLLGPYIDLKLAAKQPKRWIALPADTKPKRWRTP